MRLSPARLLLAAGLICAASTHAAEVKLALVSRSTTGGEMMLRAEIAPDAPGLKPGDFELRVRPEKGAADVAPRKLRFMVARLRGAYYFDVRKLPPLPRGRYVVSLEVKKDGRPLGRAALARALEHTPPQLDVALVIDQSFSMRRTDPERLRVAAAKTFVDLAASGNRIRTVCVVVFDATSYTLIPLTPPAERQKFHKAIDRIGTLGQTNIDKALQRAHAELSKGASPGKAAVLLTDGKNQPNAYAHAHRAFNRSGWPVYTVGLSKEADAETLRLIARQTGGRFYDAPSSEKLREVFSRICFSLERQTRIRRTVLTLNPAERKSDLVRIDDTVTRAVFSARSTQADFTFSIAPPGRPAGTGEQSSTEGRFKFFAYRKPAVGAWTASVRGGAKPAKVELETAGTTDLFPVLFPLAAEHRYGAPLEVACSLANGADPLAGADLLAKLRAADGKQLTVRLADKGGGIYRGTLTGRIADGPFALTVSARGKTPAGHAFERQLDAKGRIAPRREPEIWASAKSVDLGTLYNGETRRTTIRLRRLLPPFTDHELRVKCLPGALPAGALTVDLGRTRADGTQRLTVSATVPLAQRAAPYRAKILLSLGPKATREIPVQLRVVNPRILVNPASIDLGTMLGGSSAERRVRLRAGPRGVLDVTVTLAGKIAERIAKSRTTSLRLGGKYVAVAVTANVPDDASPGKLSGTLEVVGAFERKSIPVSLIVTRTELVAEPNLLDFGDVEPGKTVSRRLRLRVSGPIGVKATAAANFAGKLPAGSINLHGRKLTLDTSTPADVTVTLNVPSSQRPGAVRGVLRLATTREIGRIVLRARVVAAATFVVEPRLARLGHAEIGRRSSTTVTIRSTTDLPQEIRVEPRGDSGLISAEPGVVSLPPRGSVTLTLVCLPPLGTAPGPVRREFQLTGPMLPGSFAAQADVVRPFGGTFRLRRNYVPLGEVRPGRELSGRVTVTSSLDVPQEIALASDASLEHGAWLSAPSEPVTLGPHATVTLPFRCVVFPGASNGRLRQRLMVRGPLDAQPVEVSLGIHAPPSRPAGAGRLYIALLLLAASALTAAVFYLLLRALFQIPGHRMVKYFAASAVLNVAFFLLLTQMLAVKRMMEERYVAIRLDDTTDLPSTAARRPSPSDRPLEVKDKERRPESERRKVKTTDPRKDLAKTERAKLEARDRRQKRRETEFASQIDRKKSDLSRLTSRQLEEIISSARQVKRRIEQAARKEATATDVAEPRAETESKEMKTLQAAMALARAARDLQAERRTSAVRTARLQKPASRAAKLEPGRFETLLAEARTAQRKSETATEAQAPVAQVGAARAGATAGAGRRTAATTGRVQLVSARTGATNKVGATSAVWNTARPGPTSPRLAAKPGEQIKDEVQAVARKSETATSAGAPEAGVAAAYPNTSAEGAARTDSARAASVPAVSSRRGEVRRTEVARPDVTLARPPTQVIEKQGPPLAQNEIIRNEARGIARRRVTDAAAGAAEAAVGAERAAGPKSAPRTAIAARPAGPPARSAEVVPGKIAPPTRRPVQVARRAASARRLPTRRDAETIPAAVGAVERHHATKRDVTIAARLVGAPRPGAPSTDDGRSHVVAGVPRTEARQTVVRRATVDAGSAHGAARAVVPGSERIAPRAGELVSAQVGPTTRRTEVAARAALPTRTQPATKATGTRPTELKAPVGATAPGPLVTSARPTQASRDLDARVDRGELLLAALPGALRRAGVRLILDTPGPAVEPPAPRRASTTGPAHTAAPIRAVDVRHRTEPRTTPAPRRREITSVAVTTRPTTLTRPRREPHADIAVGPTRARIARTSAPSLVGRRSGGSIAFALARYSGDWDCDATAMPNLAYQLERRVGITLSTEARTIRLTDPRLMRQPFIFISGHRTFRFTNAEVAALRRYIRAGGCIWINDSTQEHDETFDRAVRRELRRVLPNNRIVRLPADHGVFSSCYDLTRGFRGYTVPPGDKYRCDYLEGITVAGRTAVIYTRNDYGDGLEIDPNTAPLMPSLTDLSPRDMQEGSVRMGINIVLHFLERRLGAANVGRMARAVRANTARLERARRTAVDTAQITTLDNFDGEFSWRLEAEWGDPAKVEPVASKAGGNDLSMQVQFALGNKKKIAISRDLLEDTDLSAYSAMVIDVHSKLPAGCRVAIGLVTMPDWQYFESPPAYIRPGDNPKVVFRLDRPNFKCEGSQWQYNQRVANLSAVRKVVLFIYPIRGGRIRIDNVALAKFAPKNPANNDK